MPRVQPVPAVTYPTDATGILLNKQIKILHNKKKNLRTCYISFSLPPKPFTITMTQAMIKELQILVSKAKKE